MLQDLFYNNMLEFVSISKGNSGVNIVSTTSINGCIEKLRFLEIKGYDDVKVTLPAAQFISPSFHMVY